MLDLISGVSRRATSKRTKGDAIVVVASLLLLGFEKRQTRRAANMRKVPEAQLKDLAE